MDPASGQLLGTFTDGDLRRTLQGRGAQVMHQPIANGIMQDFMRTKLHETPHTDLGINLECPDISKLSTSKSLSTLESRVLSQES